MVATVEEIRAHFPALSDDLVPLDGAAGTQVPTVVIEAVQGALRDAMTNLGGHFARSERSGAVIAEARSAVADLVGGEAGGVVLGPNMTTLTFLLADALAREWRPGDEVVVTSLDHDANVRPWVLAAERAGATVRWAHFDADSGELAAEAFDPLLGDRTRVVAVTAASNAIGTRPDVRAIADRAHACGALVYVDGVHATPHGPIDVDGLGADLYACSSYKFCGPHMGSVIASPELLERLVPAKLAPAASRVPERFERGTPPFEQIAGITAAIDFLAGLAGASGDRRGRLLAAMGEIEQRLDVLGERMRSGLEAIGGARILGAARHRTPTTSFRLADRTPQQVARALSRRGVLVWDGDNYALELMRRFGLAESGGAVRASLVLYNNERDVDRFLEAVSAISRES